MTMTDQESGKLIATVEQIAEMLRETRSDVKTVMSTQAKTEERLRHGADHFAKADKKLEEHDVAINKMPSGKIVYSILSLGFVALGVLIAILRG